MPARTTLAVSDAIDVVQPSTENAEVTFSETETELPRIICLHGGGTNARIFHAQCRVLRAHLTPHFRLVFPDAPFHSPAGPDVESVYAAWGPFRSWLPVFGDQVDADDFTADRIDAAIATSLDEDELKTGAPGGPVVGLLGFSQGARVAASLLMRQQQRVHRDGMEEQDSGVSRRRRSNYRFAVLMAGRGPLLSLGPGKTPSVAERWHGRASDTEPLLRLPTIHVHGLQDEGIEAHRELWRRYCDKDSTRLVEWEGGHRVPIRTGDVAAVVAEIMRVAGAQGLCGLPTSL